MRATIAVPNFEDSVEKIRSTDGSNLKQTGGTVTFAIGDNTFIMSGDREGNAFATVTRGDDAQGIAALQQLLGLPESE